MEMLKDFKGYLQSDGYAVYDNIGEREGITHLNCWAHARREFIDVMSSDRERAETALTFIQSLYNVEAEARVNDMSPDERKKAQTR